MAIFGFLLRMADLGDPIESDHATMPTGLVPEFQYLHVRLPYPSHQSSDRIRKPSVVYHYIACIYILIHEHRWGALLMPQAATKNFAGLTALRILSGAFEAIADPAFMLFTSMFYTRAEQPSRISCWYAFNGLGVAGGGLIGKSSPSLISITFPLSTSFASLDQFEKLAFTIL